MAGPDRASGRASRNVMGCKRVAISERALKRRGTMRWWRSAEVDLEVPDGRGVC